MSTALSKERGVALLSVMLVIVLLASLIYHLLNRHAMTIASSQQTVATAQMQEYALGGEAVARGMLESDWQRDDGMRVDHLEESWAEALEIQEEEGTIRIQISDLRGRVNLNSLVGEQANKRIRVVRALCAELGLDPSIGSLWSDWVDVDHEARSNSAEDFHYLGLTPPFRAANAPGSHVSETVAMIALEPTELETLSIHTAPLPTPELEINANTATGEVLDALIPPGGTPLPLNIESMSRKWESVEEVLDELPMLTAVKDNIVVASDYFEARVAVELDNVFMQLASVLYRDPETGEVWTQFRMFGRRSLVTIGDSGTDSNERSIY